MLGQRTPWPTRARIAACWALLALSLPGDAQAQDDEVPPIVPSPSRSTQLHWVQFQMVSGRVVASSVYVGTNVRMPWTGPAARRERLEIDISTKGPPSLHYELQATDDQLVLHVTNATELLVQRARPGSHYLVDFRQVPGKPLKLTLEHAGTKRTWEGASFWHLYVAEPNLVRRHLIPLMELLHPAWHLAAIGAGVEESLMQRAQSTVQPDVERWQLLVKALASPKFAERQNAERELGRVGQGVVPYLQNLDPAELDPEQAARIRSIIESLSVGYQDRSDRVATWLAGDEQVWLSLLSRPEEAKRQAATRQLALLVGGPVDFDPAAAADVRQSQLERLLVRYQTPPVEKVPVSQAPAEPQKPGPSD